MKPDDQGSILVGASPRRYICEIHREIYDFLEKHVQDKKLVGQGLDLVAEAYWAGKRMTDRLNQLQDRWQDGEFWAVNPDFRDDLQRRAERIGLLKQIKVVCIGTVGTCNRKCSWCPNQKTDMEHSLMPDEVFRRILRQLLDYDYKGDFHLFLFGEPTLDPRLEQQVSTARSWFPDNYIRIATNGAALTAERADILFRAGLSSIHYNHYDDHLANLEGKMRDAHFPKMTHFGLKALLPTFWNRAGKVEFVPEKKISGPCPHFVNKLSFKHTGALVLCCSDWNADVVFGNIMDSTLSELMMTELYQKYYRAHRDGTDKELTLCRTCNVK